ncbi:MAG: hypothetical protein K6D96_01715 [Acetatifactor sp.]|nr:hypothetical protein [Acetatifactor sp.]
MEKEITLKQIFDNLEKTAKQIEKENRFSGNNSSLACVIAAGLKNLMEG